MAELAPALVALSAAILIGETLTPPGWLGLACVSLGVGILALQRGAVHASRQSVGLALGLGVLIASYSVADGIGVRLSESVFGYMGWLFLLEAWQFGNIWYFIMKTLLSTAISLLLILITELIFARKQSFRTNTA